MAQATSSAVVRNLCISFLTNGDLKGANHDNRPEKMAPAKASTPREYLHIDVFGMSYQ